jgi:hypothetical protein
VEHPAVGKFEVVLGLGVERFVPTDIDDVKVVEQHVDIHKNAWVAC